MERALFCSLQYSKQSSKLLNPKYGGSAVKSYKFDARISELSAFLQA
jgi:hypothetical protein